jgi:hypothetical protein
VRTGVLSYHTGFRQSQMQNIVNDVLDFIVTTVTDGAVMMMSENLIVCSK